MTFFSAFTLSFGLGLLLMATVAGWVFRTSSAPLAARVVLPVLIVANACYAPFAVNSMLGFPVSASIAALPDRAVLVAFVPNDEDHRVDLWLRAGDGPPRSYEVSLDDRLKKTLRDAAALLARGEHVVLSKGDHSEGHPGGDQQGANDDQTYVIDESGLTVLAPKK